MGRRRTEDNSAGLSKAPAITQNPDIRYLGRLLGDVIRAYGGEKLYKQTEYIRSASVDRARGLQGADLTDTGLDALNLDDTLNFTRGFMLFSMLANLAEDRQGVAAEPGADVASAVAKLDASKNAGLWGVDLIHFADAVAEAEMAGQPGFFDLSDRYEALSAAGDPLERLSAVVDFELFRGPLVAALRRGPRNKGGRPPFDPVLMFKILVLQALYSLSDEATEFQIKDRLSFQRFLGVGLEGTVPDVTTVWLFRERLVTAKAIDRLFARFDVALKDQGYLAMGGQIIDATVVPAPKQRNTQEEKTAIKEGRIPKEWTPAKVRQKDRDARWSIKYSKAKVQEGADPRAAKPVDLAIPMFGYKNHIGIDRAHGLIRTWDVSAANAHDGARLPDLISKDNTASGVWADTAYRSKKNEAFLAKGMFTSNIHQKRLPRRPLPERIARANARRSKVRAAVEHVFAGQKHRMGLVVRTIGIARATIKIGMANLVYNFQRLAWLEGRAAPA